MTRSTTRSARPRFLGQRALITGGSSGIGLAAALQLAREGASVCVAARREGPLADAVARLRENACLKDQVFSSLALDISDRAAVREAAPRALAALGGLELLINNAGVTHVGRLDDVEDEVFERVLRINYLGAVWVTRALLPHFRSARGGTIAFVSSFLGLMPVFGYAAYSASKHALTGFAECLRQELLRDGVRVCVAFPGDADTPMLAAELPARPPETRKLAELVPPISAELVASSLLDSVARGRAHAFPGFWNHASLWAARRFPAITRRVIDRDLRRGAAREPE
ncbi:MAG: SDR family NAD(P)-dependent oxidoreductase [Myxococcales bacterium]|nr:SDR family NAD(P)-dependent oxidoreductase [Myxococcales bacterium]